MLVPGGQAPGCGKCCLHQPGGQSRGEQHSQQSKMYKSFLSRRRWCGRISTITWLYPPLLKRTWSTLRQRFANVLKKWQRITLWHDRHGWSHICPGRLPMLKKTGARWCKPWRRVCGCIWSKFWLEHRSQYFLINSYREEDDCRLQCDKPFDQKWYVHAYIVL